MIIYVDSSLRTVPYGTLLLLSMALDVKCTMVKFKRVVVRNLIGVVYKGSGTYGSAP